MSKLAIEKLMRSTKFIFLGLCQLVLSIIVGTYTLMLLTDKVMIVLD